MEIIPIEAGPLATIGYLAIDKATLKAAAIDVPLASSSIYCDLLKEKNATLEAIILTHTHWDHTGETAELKKLTNAKVYCHSADQYRIIDPMNHTVYPMPIKLEGVIPDKLLSDNDIIEIGDLKFEVRHTPGHTEGGICLVNHQEKIVFSGDTLFNGSIGRTDFPGGNFEDIINSIKNKLFSLDDDFTVFCGHGEKTTIENEKMYNPFLFDGEFVTT